jgi:hypothetical protein
MAARHGSRYYRSYLVRLGDDNDLLDFIRRVEASSEKQKREGRGVRGEGPDEPEQFL